jgi:hypothetical protein
MPSAGLQAVGLASSVSVERGSLMDELILNFLRSFSIPIELFCAIIV